MTKQPIRRALLSVSDKTGLIDFARKLHDEGVELVSTGGTARAIAKAGLPVRDVAELTGYPEMMDGRVKTLHPAVHGGLLALRDNPDHAEAMKSHNIKGIDLLVVNLYPFKATVAKGADFDTCVENIDIGGPAMIRAGAKNWQFTAVLTDLNDYSATVEAVSAGGYDAPARKALAAKAYARTAAYDAAIASWYAAQLSINDPERVILSAEFATPLRYGENPHQNAAFYTTQESRNGVTTAKLVQGKALSYNNINDADAAFELVSEFAPPAPAPTNSTAHTCAIIKHANPCGVATRGSLVDAYRHAYRTDTTSAFGGIVALNTVLDGETAAEIVKIFTEVVIAPDADADARALFAAKPNLRLMLTGGLADVTAPGRVVRPVAGGLLVQDRDNGRVTKADLTCVTKRQPTEAELADLIFAWRVAKHVKSNAIVYAKNGATVGIGAGQMSRVDSTRIAARKAGDIAEAEGLDASPTIGSVVASDAFFPFADGLITAAEAGATALIQPGGSMRDEEVIAAADDAGLAMVFTGMRHFRH